MPSKQRVRSGTSKCMLQGCMRSSSVSSALERSQRMRTEERSESATSSAPWTFNRGVSTELRVIHHLGW